MTRKKTQAEKDAQEAAKRTKELMAIHRKAVKTVAVKSGVAALTESTNKLTRATEDAMQELRVVYVTARELIERNAEIEKSIRASFNAVSERLTNVLKKSKDGREKASLIERELSMVSGLNFDVAKELPDIIPCDVDNAEDFAGVVATLAKGQNPLKIIENCDTLIAELRQRYVACGIKLDKLRERIKAQTGGAESKAATTLLEKVRVTADAYAKRFDVLRDLADAAERRVTRTVDRARMNRAKAISEI